MVHVDVELGAFPLELPSLRNVMGNEVESEKEETEARKRESKKEKKEGKKEGQWSLKKLDGEM